MNDNEYVLGVDIGGTFTDLLLLEKNTGKMKILKVSSTPSDPSEGVLIGVNNLLKEEKIDPQSINLVIHGSTVAINTVIEKKGANTGLLTTAGFKDILYIGRQNRPSLFHYRLKRPEPLVSRDKIKEMSERVLYNGKIHEKLDKTSAKILINDLKKTNVDAVAICLIHSYANPSHELELKELVKEAIGNVYLSVSSELLPEYREFERMNTTVMNAYIGPKVSKYIQKLENGLKLLNLNKLLIMQANGGVMSPEAVLPRPINIIESGPAGGVLAASYIAKLTGRNKIISFDMGGTTAKTCLVQDYKPFLSSTYEVLSSESGDSLVIGSGYPLKIPVMDMYEVGAGGGSIGWIDEGGALRVGPKSAGADPGPACYAKGGKNPTITDANLILGRLNPDYFLGGKLKLDVKLAKSAFESLTDKLNMDTVKVAEGITRIANTTMIRGLRRVSVEKGYDLRDFHLVAYGGAAPIEACNIANEVGIKEIVIPLVPGLFSALGFLVTNLEHHYSQTLIKSFKELSIQEVENKYNELEQKALDQLKVDNIPDQDIQLIRSMDVRYAGQGFELAVPVNKNLKDTDIESLGKSFNNIHKIRYGYNIENEPLEVVNLRLVGIGKIIPPKFNFEKELEYSSQDYVKSERDVFFSDVGWTKSLIYERDTLKPGIKINGPAIIEEVDSTIIVNPNYVAHIDGYKNVIIKKVVNN